MTEPRSHIDLAMARVVHSTNDLVEVRIGAFVRIDPRGIRASLLARQDLIGPRRGPILYVVSGDPDWDPATLRMDHFEDFAGSIEAMGIVVTNKVLALAASTYFSLFPADFPVLIDSDEAVVRRWLAAH